VAADPRKLPGRYTVSPPGSDPEWPCYWDAYLGEERVNGGVCKDAADGAERALSAIWRAREELLSDSYHWDAEKFAWVRHWVPV